MIRCFRFIDRRIRSASRDEIGSHDGGCGIASYFLLFSIKSYIYQLIGIYRRTIENVADAFSALFLQDGMDESNDLLADGNGSKVGRN